MKALPGTSRVRQIDTHRLIPARFSDDPIAILGIIAENDADLAELARLESLTDEQVLAENDLLPGIGVQELVFGVPHARIINGAFTHANPFGSRFNGPTRGAWYAGFEIETSRAEIAFHRTVHLAEIGQFQDEAIYVDYLADFGGEFHDFLDYATGGCYTRKFGLWRSLASALAWGARGPGFKSRQPDQIPHTVKASRQSKPRFWSPTGVHFRTPCD